MWRAGARARLPRAWGETIDPRGALGPGETAWIVALPCAIVTVAAIAVLGPAIGHAFLGPGPGDGLWPPEAFFTRGQPEPVKHGRYLIALLGPVLLAAAIVVGDRRPPRLPRPAVRGLIAVSQLLVLALLVAAVVAQARGAISESNPVWVIFGNPTIAIALLLTVLAVGVLGDARLVSRIARAARDTPRRRIACAAVAVACTALWVSTAIDSDTTVAGTPSGGLMPWVLDDPFAILTGLTPLVDFHAMYAQLWPYASAAVLKLLGTSITVFTLFMTTVSALALLAIFAVLRRIVRSWLLALALYLPFVATGFLFVVGRPGFRVSNAQVFSMWPMRYSGAYLLAWLTARHLDGASPRRVWPLFLAAGLVTIDNLEFGLGALAATIVAVVCAQPRTRTELLRLAREAALALAGAVAVVVLLTLASAGTLPKLEYLLEYPRIFGVLGLVSQRMPLWGFHLALYATFVAAIGAGVVQLLQDRRDPLLGGMLAWSGTFGLLAASYFVGRSDTTKLVSLFSAWCFALALLVIVVVRDLVARPRRWPGLAPITVLFAFALATCSLGETPAPWARLAHWSRPSPASAYPEPAATRFVAAHTSRGEKVAILIPMGHRIAYDLGAVNVSPYSFLEGIVTRRQLAALLDAVRRAHATKIFVPDSILPQLQGFALGAEGFARRAVSPAGYSEWSSAPSG